MKTIAEILFQVLEEPFGLIIKTNRPKAAGQAFYREIYQNPAFLTIGVVQKENNTIWLVRKDRIMPQDGEAVPVDDIDLEVNLDET